MLVLAPIAAHAHGELLIRIAAATRQIATNPAPQLYLSRGELYREDQNWVAAENDYRKALELGVARDGVDLCRAQAFADQNQFGRARDLLSNLIARNTATAKALLARARVFVKLHEPQAAVTDFQRAADSGAQFDSAAWLEWAQMLVAEKRSVEALTILDRGIQRSGAVSTLQVYAFDVELARGKTSAALIRLQSIIDQADRKERWLTRRGDIQLADGNRVAARESYVAAIAAIKHLPKILQASPAILSLKSEIDAALAGTTESPSISQVGLP